MSGSSPITTAPPRSPWTPATQGGHQALQKTFGGPRTAPVRPARRPRLPRQTEEKNTGLTDAGCPRVDPTIGRFISVDPVLDASDPQQMLGYTYANDNPVSGAPTPPAC